MNQDTIPSQLGPVTVPSALGPIGSSQNKAESSSSLGSLVKWVLVAVAIAVGYRFLG